MEETAIGEIHARSLVEMEEILGFTHVMMEI